MQKRTITPAQQRATHNSAGYDLKLTQTLTIPPRGMASGKTGTFVTMQAGEVAYLFSRSSLFKKYGVILANSVGVIDADFKDEIQVQFINMTDYLVCIPHGERVVQLVFSEYKTACNEIAPTAERTGGHGSTGRG